MVKKLVFGLKSTGMYYLWYIRKGCDSVIVEFSTHARAMEFHDAIK